MDGKSPEVDRETALELARGIIADETCSMALRQKAARILVAITGDLYAPIRYDEFPSTPEQGNLAVIDDVLYCWSSGGGWKPVPK